MADNYRKLLKARMDTLNAVGNLGLKLYAHSGWKQINRQGHTMFAGKTYRETFNLLCAFTEGFNVGRKWATEEKDGGAVIDAGTIATDKREPVPDI